MNKIIGRQGIRWASYELFLVIWTPDELNHRTSRKTERVHTQFMSYELVFIWSSWGWELWFIRSSWKFEEFIGELVWAKRSYRVHSFLDPPGPKNVMSSSMSFLVRFIWSSYSYELSLWTPFELQWGPDCLSREGRGNTSRYTSPRLTLKASLQLKRSS